MMETILWGSIEEGYQVSIAPMTKKKAQLIYRIMIPLNKLKGVV